MQALKTKQNQKLILEKQNKTHIGSKFSEVVFPIIVKLRWDMKEGKYTV